MRYHDTKELPAKAKVKYGAGGTLRRPTDAHHHQAHCGFSAAPGQRAHQLRAELLCYSPGDIGDERALHARFDADRVAGEWFRPSPALLAYIAELTEQAA